MGKKILKIILIFGLILIFLCSCTQHDEAPLWNFEKVTKSGKWKTYENKRDGYFLQYPKGWLRKRFINEGFTFTAFVKVEDNEIISIFTTTVKDAGWELDGPALIESILQGSNVRILEEHQVSPQGYRGYQILLLKKMDNYTIKMNIVLFKIRDTVYFVGAQALQHLYEKYEELINQSINSLKIDIKKEME